MHGEDIRRPLGITREYPIDHVLPALPYQLATSTSMGGGRQLADSLRLVTTDAPFAHGSGLEVRSTALALLLAVSGRPIGAAELSSPGASRLLTGDA